MAVNKTPEEIAQELADLLDAFMWASAAQRKAICRHYERITDYEWPHVAPEDEFGFAGRTLTSEVLVSLEEATRLIHAMMGGY
jgi:hypothetical protein